MVHISNLIRQSDNLPFQCRRHARTFVVADSIEHFPGQVQSLPMFLQHLYYTDTLFIVFKSTRTHVVQSSLSCMPKRSMPKIMPQCNCLHQIFVQPERLSDRPGVLRYFQRMRQPCPVMVSDW